MIAIILSADCGGGNDDHRFLGLPGVPGGVPRDQRNAKFTRRLEGVNGILFNGGKFVVEIP